jgi:hypothetical protein
MQPVMDGACGVNDVTGNATSAANGLQAVGGARREASNASFRT